MTESPLHVAILSVHTCPLAALGGKKTGGMNVYVRELSKELGRRDIKVDIFTRSQDPCVPHINEGELAPGVRVIHIPAGPESPLPTAENYPHLQEFTDNVLAFVSNNDLQYDLIHSHYWLSGWVALQLRDVWNIPITQMFHTLGRMKDRIAQNKDQKENERRIEVEDMLVQQVDILIASTPAERVQLMWLYQADMRKIQVIPPGVDLKQFSPIECEDARAVLGISPAAQLLLFVGRIEPLKGIDTLLKAIALLKQCSPYDTNDLYLAVIGGPAPEDISEEDSELLRLRALSEELGLDERVAFLGAKNQAKLQYFYSAADAVIMPSHYESFGMVALEAMACGTAVVASEVGGLAYLIQDGVTGFHVPDQDPEALAGRVKLILDHPDLREEMSHAAAEYAQGYSWEIIAERIHEMYAMTTGVKTKAGHA